MIRIIGDTDDCYCMTKLSCLLLVHAFGYKIIIHNILILLLWGQFEFYELRLW